MVSCGCAQISPFAQDVPDAAGRPALFGQRRGFDEGLLRPDDVASVAQQSGAGQHGGHQGEPIAGGPCQVRRSPGERSRRLLITARKRDLRFRLEDRRQQAIIPETL